MRIGWDNGSLDGDCTVVAATVRGFTLVCEIPKGLGNVTDLKIVNDRCIAETDSGISFIVPTAQ